METLMFSVHYRNEIRIEKGETAPTVSAAYGMGGGITPYVCLEEDDEDRVHTDRQAQRMPRETPPRP